MAKSQTIPPAATNTDGSPLEQSPEQIAAVLRTALMEKFGPVQYSHETGTVTLYADKRRAGVKNGRAGHVSLSAANGGINVQCSVYMDVEDTTETRDGRSIAGVKKTYRFAVPKNVKVVFTDAAEEKKFKKLHLQAWLDSRTAKQSLSDASGDDASVTETEATATA